MKTTYIIGLQGEEQAKQILAKIGFKNITHSTENRKFYDFKAEKDNATYYIEVKTRTKNRFIILTQTVKDLIDTGNGWIMLIFGYDYKLIKAVKLRSRLKDNVMVGLSFNRNYGDVAFCTRCGNEVFVESHFCPKCKSPYWNKPYKGINYE